MTPATTKASRRTLILSWGVGLAVYAGLAVLLVLVPRTDSGAWPPPDPAKRERQKARRESEAEERRNRALPPQYAEDLVQQSEVLVKRELHERLTRFRNMADDLRQREHQLLAGIEARPRQPHSPSNANDTSRARKVPPVGHPPLGPDPSVQALYERLAVLESEVHQNHTAAKAAEWALQRGQSFPEVFETMQPGTTRMPEFEQLILNQTGGAEWPRSPSSHASAGLQIDSVADLNHYRGILGQASRESGLAESRLHNLLGYPNRRGRPPPAIASGPPYGRDDGGMSGPRSNVGTGPFARYEAKLDEAMVKAQALPGRRFSRDSARRGWLYINTWYMIGPWDNYGRGDFALPHPPELAVDFDAVYTDGLKGLGIAETESHPIRIEGRQVELDGTLRWKFMQSESMHNTVPVTMDRATYYAYTEIYFEEPVTMLVAIGTDDSGKLWINGQEIWKDLGTSWYHIDEHIAPFHFQQGWNRILVRLENGGGAATGFSFLICPKEAAMAQKAASD